jgi:hypothetical protein
MRTAELVDGIVSKATAWTEFANYVALGSVLFDEFISIDADPDITMVDAAKAYALLQQVRSWHGEAKRIASGNLRNAYGKTLANRAREHVSRAQRTIDGIVSARRRPQGMTERDVAQLQRDIKHLEQGADALHTAAVRDFLHAGGEDASLIRPIGDIKAELYAKLREGR